MLPVLLADGFELLFPELEGLLLCEVLPEEPQAASPSTRTAASIIAKVFFIVLFPFVLDSGHGETSHCIPYTENIQ